MQFGTREKFLYFKCPSCDCLQIAEYPKNMNRFYGESYYSLQRRGGILPSFKRYFQLKRDAYAAGSRDILPRILFNLKPNIQLQEAFHKISPELLAAKTKRILDIGCGRGDFLDILNGFGFNKLHGIDPFIEREVQLKKEVTIFKKSLEEVHEKYDLILLQHSLEHMPNQLQIAVKIESLLSDDGVCIIKVPLSSCYAWERYGVNWFQLDAPRHFYLHSPKSLGHLLNQANLYIYKTIYDSTEMQLMGSEFYLRDIPYIHWSEANKDYGIISERDIEEYKKIAVRLNIERNGDQAIFFAKKMPSI